MITNLQYVELHDVNILIQNFTIYIISVFTTVIMKLYYELRLNICSRPAVKLLKFRNYILLSEKKTTTTKYRYIS